MDAPLRLLVIEDNQADFLLLQRHLRHQGLEASCVRIDSVEELESALANQRWDAVLADYNVPGMAFEQSLNLIRSRESDLPIILVTGALGEEKAVDLLKLGCSDFVLKDNLARLVTVIERSLREFAERRARRQAEEAWHESEYRYRSVIAALFEGVILMDADGTIQAFNASAQRILGLSVDQLAGRAPFDPTWQAIHEDGSPFPSNTQPAWVTLQTGQPCHKVIMGILKPGSSVTWLTINSQPLYRPDDAIPYAVVVSFADVTDRKQAEEELRCYKDQLEETVQRRTAELLLARDEAEAANKAKSVFLANMSHELRTPLNAILGFSSMMRKNTRLEQSERDNLDVINRSGEHLLSIINDVLEMSKIETGRIQLEEVPFDLGGMVRDITVMLSVRAKKKGLRLVIDQSSQLPRFIIGDEGRLRQILINLLGNAIKFTPQGSVTLRLRTKQNATEHLLIEVEDTGLGIPSEDQQRIFEPFVQLGEHAINQGTGLGLTITRHFVQMIGGSLILQSTPGKGSLFQVELPLKEAREAETLLKSAEQAKGDVISLAPGQPAYRILIVEHQLENRQLLTQLMESVGFQVKLAENGEQGVQLFQSWQPHLIWMDRRMPVMNGIEATKAIRELPGGKEVKIVAMTDPAFMEQRDEMLNIGMDDFVRKPFRFNEIYECLSKHLGVRYIYEGNPELEKPIMPLTPDMLTVLPEDLRSDLKSALESLESERIALVIGQVAPYGLQLQKLLAYLAENFDYGAILNALRTNVSANEA